MQSSTVRHLAPSARIGTSKPENPTLETRQSVELLKSIATGPLAVGCDERVTAASAAISRAASRWPARRLARFLAPQFFSRLSTALNSRVALGGIR